MTKSRELQWTSDEREFFAPTPDCFMMRASAIREMNEEGRYFVEELSRFPALIDFLWRAKFMEGSMLSVPSAIAWRQRAKRTGKGKARKIKLQVRSRLELQDIHVKLSPKLLRIRHAPWLCFAWVKRSLLILLRPSLWLEYLRKPLSRFRLAKQQSRRFSHTKIPVSQMTNWFV